MGYDFKRSFAQTFTNGVSTELVGSHVRRLHGFFGPKFQTGRGPFRVFVTGKVGFENFSVTNDNANHRLHQLSRAYKRHHAICGVSWRRFRGVRWSNGPIGVRAEIGDDIYFLNGTHNYRRISLGPQFRF
jgi:hypothetical protein